MKGQCPHGAGTAPPVLQAITFLDEEIVSLKLLISTLKSYESRAQRSDSILKATCSGSYSTWNSSTILQSLIVNGATQILRHYFIACPNTHKI
jgi:hypothetical protein